MNIWIQLYLAVFVVLSIAGILDDYRDRRPFWFLALSVLSNIIIVLLFIAYWNSSLLDGAGILSQVLFIAAIGWEAYQAVLDSHATEEQANSETEGGRSTIILGTLLFLALSLPAFVVAGISAFRGS